MLSANPRRVFEISQVGTDIVAIAVIDAYKTLQVPIVLTCSCILFGFVPLKFTSSKGLPFATIAPTGTVQLNNFKVLHLTAILLTTVVPTDSTINTAASFDLTAPAFGVAVLTIVAS